MIVYIPHTHWQCRQEQGQGEHTSHRLTYMASCSQPIPNIPVRDKAVPPRWYQLDTHPGRTLQFSAAPFAWPRLGANPGDPWTAPNLPQLSHQHGPGWCPPKRPPNMPLHPQSPCQRGPTHLPTQEIPSPCHLTLATPPVRPCLAITQEASSPAPDLAYPASSQPAKTTRRAGYQGAMPTQGHTFKTGRGRSFTQPIETNTESHIQ